jgi:ribosomal-protein-alanine N-acetyltransferase
MEANFQIRLATADDIPRVVALDRATESTPHWPVAEYIAALQPHRCLFVAETISPQATPHLVGFAVGRITVVPTEGAAADGAELESVAVSIPSRRAGIGRVLCRAVIDWAIRHRAPAIDLEVRSRGDGPIALYRKLGFAAVGRRSNYYRDPPDDALLMRLEPGTASR